MPPRQVWFIRHAESMANTGAACKETNEQVPLSALGFKQAKELAGVLERAPSLFVCSPYLRAQQTAAPILEKFPDVACETWPVQEFVYLRGLAFEIFRNTTPEELKVRVENYWNTVSPDYNDGQGTESFNQLLKRARDVIQKLESSSQGYIVVFTHNLFMWALWMLINRSTLMPVEMMRMQTKLYHGFKIPNVGILKAQVIDGKLGFSGPAGV